MSCKRLPKVREKFKVREFYFESVNLAFWRKIKENWNNNSTQLIYCHWWLEETSGVIFISVVFFHNVCSDGKDGCKGGLDAAIIICDIKIFSIYLVGEIFFVEGKSQGILKRDVVSNHVKWFGLIFQQTVCLWDISSIAKVRNSVL